MNSRNALASVLSSLLLCAASTPASGQEALAPATLTRGQASELEKWIKKDAAWQEWHKKWGNHASVRQRPRPEPPLWLTSECERSFGDEGVLARGCALLETLKRNAEDGADTTQMRQAIATKRTQGERLLKDRFINMVHVGGGWPVMDSSEFKYGGIIESHVAIPTVGRMAINLPGVMLLSVPDKAGGRGIRLGTHVGVSIRLGDFIAFGKSFNLHLNVSNAWMSESVGSFGFAKKLSLAGLSITKKAR